jgi:ribosomal-protein-alanine N-acetyltransferase
MGVDVITIRPLESDDVAAVLALEQANQPQPWSEGVFNDELTAPSRTYLVADDGEVFGFGGVMVVGDEAHVTNVLVDPSRRNEGVGRRLLVDLIRAAVAEGARHMTLEVRSQNVAGRALYSRLGFVPVGIRPNYYEDDDALVLWLHDVDTIERFGSRT